MSQRAYRRILVPIDFSESSRHALSYALDFASKLGPARLLLVHAYYVPPEIEAFAPDRVPGYLGQLSEQAAKDPEKLLTELQDAQVTTEYLAEPGAPDLPGLLSGPGPAAEGSSPPAIGSGPARHAAEPSLRGSSHTGPLLLEDARGRFLPPSELLLPRPELAERALAQR